MANALQAAQARAAAAPAGFDDDELDRIFAKVCELHNSLLELYAERDQSTGKETT